MKSILPQRTFYFSAYPLKALNLSEAEKKSYLHVYTKSDKSIKRPVNSKILPMVNPYPELKKENRINKIEKSKDQIEERENDWFANYE